jgi:FAD binding domain
MGAIQSVITTTTGVGACLQASIPSSLVALPTKWDYYLVDVTPYNLNIPVNPSAVTYPETTAHVQAIVKCAAQYKYQVQAKSGGHSYGNFGADLGTSRNCANARSLRRRRHRHYRCGSQEDEGAELGLHYVDGARLRLVDTWGPDHSDD